MNDNKIREYVMVKDKFNHPKLEEIGCYDYYGDLRYTDHVYDMLTRTFKMDRLITEVTYVVALDHKKMPKGICKVGQGGLGEAPAPMQSIFTFLLLAGASSFIMTHNHISDTPEASDSDKMITTMAKMLSTGFDMEFIGHMIINPCGYIIDGGVMDGIVGEVDEDGDIHSWNRNKEEFYDEDDILFDEDEEYQIASENTYMDREVE